MPVLRQQGDTALAGTLNLSSSIQLRVERVAAESFIARMALMVEEAQNRKRQSNPWQTESPRSSSHLSS